MVARTDVAYICSASLDHLGFDPKPGIGASFEMMTMRPIHLAIENCDKPLIQ